MKKTRFFYPYTNNRCALTKSGIGVYIIKKSGKIVYIGYSSYDVKKTMYRHFQNWNDKTQRRVVYKDLKEVTVRVVFCRTEKQAAILEEVLILKHRPKDNEQKINLYSTAESSAVENTYSASEEVPF